MNILVLTPIYPGAGVPDTYTPVVHYFAREWVKMGHKVVVINLNTYMPRVYYMVPNFIMKYVSIKTGLYLPKQVLSKPVEYDIDDVHVIRIPIKKILPHSVPNNKSQQKQSELIIKKLSEIGFTPSCIVNHWGMPLYISSILKQQYGCKSAMILHGLGDLVRFPNYQNLMTDIDLWGLRSRAMIEEFNTITPKPQTPFICESGIPEEMINPDADMSRWNNNYVYVGYMMKRKYPDVTIKALNHVYNGIGYKLNLVGGGELEKNIYELVKQTDKNGCINMTGKIPRSEVVKYLDEADCFIMVSRGEVFGLVYIEAMARGCITVAGRGEGMTGIIEDGVNGFLCEPGNQLELEQIITRIRNMSIEERRIIRQNAMATAINYTDKKCAERYLSHITSLVEQN